MSTHVTKLFEGKTVSKIFAKTRPVVSSGIVSKVIGFLEEKVPVRQGSALDVGCGPGLSTQLFAPYFTNVLGLDVSETQISEAKKLNQCSNVDFRTGTGESLPLANESVKLVTSIQTAHWLDLPKFFNECNRILIPHGVIALIGYGLLEIRSNSNSSLNLELNKAVKEMYDLVANSGSWNEKRYIVDRQYREIVLPYEDKVEIRDDESLYLFKNMTVSEFVA